MIIDMNFYVAVSLMKTRLPDNDQCHALAKYGKFILVVGFAINCQITGPLSKVFLICYKLHVKTCDTGFLY